MVQNEVCNVLFCPFLEESGIAVLAFRVYPHIETLCHHHHSEAVADIHLHCRRHVVRGSDGITSHFLHQLYLAYQCSLVDGSSERSEVVVQADSLYLSRNAVQHESALFADADSPDSEVRYCLIYHLVVLHQAGAHFIQGRGLWRPQQWFAHGQFCLYPAAFRHVKMVSGIEHSLAVENFHYKGIVAPFRSLLLAQLCLV